MPEPAASTVTILVVEDDQAVAEVMRTLLNDVPGWGATVVHDGAAARAVFRHVRVEVLVVDVNLPGISGLELLHLLRADTGWLEPPVVLVSAEPSQSGVAEAVAEGIAMRILAKPFDVDQLIQAVEQAIQAHMDASRRASRVK
jgi:CheY-like chemotaxis protein